ncbi:MAG TPA: murein L,D-transpeptidase catalytic domain family protein [Thermoanaerobaculia bacterium]|nr:murein L,D-transpeptidase catalytic domain family protein [Thermoanaerobaculia bacterium]
MDRSPVPAAADVDRHFQKPVFSRRLRLLGILLLLAAGTRLDTRVFAAPAPTAVPALAASDLQGLSPQVLAAALDAVACARTQGIGGREDLLTLIDYSLPSTEPRLWVLDLAHGKVLFHEIVAHGQGSGENRATRFSNAEGSLQTSLGLFKTGGTYEGKNGYSLKLLGLDPGINDRAEERKIVMHGAWYVSPEQIRRYGRLGRSWGCPALSQASAHPVIDTIKGGSFVFAYAADPAWRQASSSRRCTPGTPGMPATPVIAAVATGSR